MHVMTFASFKGGAGKSTAAMATCSALLAAGRSVTMIDADENVPLVAWADLARVNNLWDDGCAVHRGDDMRGLERAYAEAERASSDVAIIDTRGGGSELNNACMASADVVIVPTALTGLDIAAALSTFEYAVRLFHDMGQATPVLLLLQRVPVGRLSVSQAQDLEALSQLPRFEPLMHARDAFGAISKRGMLHRLLERSRSDPMQRLTVNHLNVAMNEADAVRRAVETQMEGE